MLRTEKGDIVGAGGRDLNPAQRSALRPGETPAKLDKAHAEVTVLRQADAQGAKPQAMGVSRDICKDCAAEIRSSGGKLTSERTAVWPEKMTTFTSFDDEYLFDRLSRMGESLRGLFAMLAATRLRGAIDCYLRSDPEALQTVSAAHRGLWADVEHVRALETAAIEVAIDVCADLLPDEDEMAATSWAPYFDDAVASLMYAYRCRRTGETREAVWAARRGYDSVDLFAMREMDLLPADPSAELRVLRHPTVQAELQRQTRDLQELEQLGAPLERASVRALRSRAEKESAIPLRPRN